MQNDDRHCEEAPLSGADVAISRLVRVVISRMRERSPRPKGLAMTGCLLAYSQNN